MEYFEDHHLELYNLHDDIGESKNLAKEMPEQAKKLHAQMLAWRQAIKAPMPTPNTGETKPSKGNKKQNKAGKQQENGE